MSLFFNMSRSASAAVIFASSLSAPLLAGPEVENETAHRQQQLSLAPALTTEATAFQQLARRLLPDSTVFPQFVNRLATGRNSQSIGKFLSGSNLALFNFPQFLANLESIQDNEKCFAISVNATTFFTDRLLHSNGSKSVIEALLPLQADQILTLAQRLEEHKDNLLISEMGADARAELIRGLAQSSLVFDAEAFSTFSSAIFENAEKFCNEYIIQGADGFSGVIVALAKANAAPNDIAAFAAHIRENKDALFTNKVKRLGRQGSVVAQEVSTFLNR